MTTQTRVRELVYLLRQSRVFERTDQWGAAIRELVALGSAALPELLLELKNTERSATLRGLLLPSQVRSRRGERTTGVNGGKRRAHQAEGW